MERSVENLRVRTYEPADQAAVTHLFEHGLLAGQIDPYDTAADVEIIADEYLSRPQSHFWVAEVEGRVVGMVGVANEEQTAEVRRLRVDKAWQDTAIAARLLETALAHCKHHGFLKIRLDTRFDPSAARDLFDRFGFQHTRTKERHGKELLEFYLDLYRREE
jgi:putative acetyltransferase